MEPDEPLLIRSTADACTDLLRREILAGRYNENSFVIDQIAQRLGVSHTPVREAVRRLEAEGFLRYKPRKGVRVRPLYLNEFEELVTLRKSLEPIVMKRAIEIGDSTIAATAKAKLKEWKNSSGATEMLNAQWEFFRAMYEASRLVRTMEVIETNWCFVERFHRHSWEYSGEVKTMDLNHKQRILDLFAKKDAENAVIALDRCIDWGASIVRGKLSASTLSALEPDGTRR